MYFDADDAWNEDIEAQIVAMEANAARVPTPPAPAALRFTSPAYPPLQLKPVSPPAPPSIFKASSFRLPLSKPAAQMISKPKPSFRKPAAKAAAKAKARARASTDASAEMQDAGGDGAEEEQNAEDDAVPAVKSTKRPPPAFPPVAAESIGAPFIDLDTADTWIYPSNFPKREYQFSIVGQALFKNTLVSLPTGLGKTFIAAVVMYNYFRWYPGGKIVFMAPTKPLVAQQIAACRDIVGIPMGQTAEMTGAMPPEQRKVCWRERRVFFVTPQILANDLESGYCPREKFVCVVVDEAHRAQGKYAYCTVVRDIASATSQFRVLALTATPGSTVAQVQHVISNLLISHLEVRSEHDLDVRQYTHEKLIELVTVPLSAEVVEANRLFIELVKIPITRLCNQGAFYQRDVEKITQYTLVQEQRKLQANPPANLSDQMGLVISQFSMAISLYSAWKMLSTHGMSSARRSLEDTEQKALQGQAKNKKELLTKPEWINLLRFLREKQDAASHPKLEKVEEIVVEHFKKYPDSRAMIFSSYRESVRYALGRRLLTLDSEIAAMLERHEPLVKPMTFIGQSSQRTKGLSQKEQTRIVREFRDGRHNCLVSTSIGEEGLDIGEVDLIICFDSQQSPIRQVQRMGRTGRKRQGRCVVLLSGTEEANYKKSGTKKKHIDKTMFEKRATFKLYEGKNRMIPPEIKPRAQYVELAIPSAQDILNEPPLPLPEAELVELDEEQQEYMQDKWTVTVSQQPERLMRALNRDASRHAVPSPIHTISHSRQCIVLMSAVSWAEEHANDDEDAYEKELAAYLDMSMVSEPKTRKRKGKAEAPADKDASEEAAEKTSKKKASAASKKAEKREERKEQPAAEQKSVSNRLDKFKFVRPQARTASPSPPRAASASPSIDSPHAVINNDDSSLGLADTAGGEAKQGVTMRDADERGPNKENVAKSGAARKAAGADTADAEFDELFPPLRARVAALRSPPPAASLPKAPIFPARFLATLTSGGAPPAAKPAAAPTTLFPAQQPPPQKLAPEPLRAVAVPAAAAPSLPPKPALSLPSFELDPFADSLGDDVAKSLPPKSSSVTSPSALGKRAYEQIGVVPTTKRAYSPSLFSQLSPPPAIAQAKPLVAVAASKPQSTITEASEVEVVTSSPGLLSQLTKPTAPKSLPPKPSVPIPSFDLDSFDESPPPAKRAEVVTEKEAPAKPVALPPAPPVPIPSFDFNLDESAEPPPASKYFNAAAKPVPAAASVVPNPSAPAASKSLLPKPPVPLPSFDFDAEDIVTHTPPASSMLLSKPAATPPSSYLEMTDAHAPSAKSIALESTTASAAAPRRTLGLSSLLKGSASANKPAKPIVASAHAPPPSVPPVVPLKPAATPKPQPLVSATPPPSISPPSRFALTTQRYEAALPSQLDGEVECPICQLTFPSENAVSQHIDDEHGEGREKPAKKRDEILTSPASEEESEFDSKPKKPAAAATTQPKFQRLRKGPGGAAKRRLRVNRGNMFIDDEAVESNDSEEERGGEEDEEEADVEVLSQYEDDAALATPEKDAVSPRSMMGIYRQSLISTPTARQINFSSAESPQRDSISESSSSSAFPSPIKVATAKPSFAERLALAAPADKQSVPPPTAAQPATALSSLSSKAPGAISPPSVAPKPAAASHVSPLPSGTTVPKPSQYFSTPITAPSKPAAPPKQLPTSKPPTSASSLPFPSLPKNPNASFRSAPFAKR